MPEPDAGFLPASLETAWGLRERPAKGPRPALGLDRIVDAAITLAARDGIEAVSMGRVAKELGASTMSLYRYVAAKDELYVLMADTGVGTPPPVPEGTTGWRALLTTWAHAQRDVFRHRTWLLRIPISGPPATPNQVAWMERGLAALDGTGLHGDERLGTLTLVGGFIRNQATLTADLADAVRRSGADPDRVLARYAHTLRRFTDPVRQPAITRLLDAGVFSGPDDDPDADFRFGLERILDGLAPLVARRTAEAGGTGHG
ncbi:TetR/AcrR family transcriptional regulator [Streptomyces sp. NPDC049906]|uniref:TetR/AcrR family transcriptional regulator n=1 Tax=Streptomyces sp. NPDC049906 TaxID=3155656 RepID=UPI00341D8023